MQRPTWNQVKTTLSTWRVWGLPGAIVIGLVVAARLTGSLQGLELLTFDTFLRLRPPEPEDDRVVLVGFNRTDIQKVGYPIPEQELVRLVNMLQTYQPAVIGLHISPNQVAELDNAKLFTNLKQYKNLVISELILSAADQTLAPPKFPKDQVGFIDIIQDTDDHIRRLVLGAANPINLDEYKYSLTIRLVEKYLVSRDQELKLGNGTRDVFAMQFGSTELPRLLPDSGAYVGADTGGPQILLNPRNGKNPFRLVSLDEIKTGKFDPNWFRDRIVIIGIHDPIIRPVISTAASVDINSFQIQAHAVSQIVSAVLDKRPLIDTWNNEWEYLWIVSWGIVAIILGRSSLSPKTKLVSVGIGQAGLLGIGYFTLATGWWIPIFPVTLVWLINGIGYTVFHKYDWVLRSRLKENQRLAEERQRAIEETFNVIHNGPLQTLSNVLRQLRDSNISSEKLITILENLNIEIRGIGEHLKQESLTQENSLYLGDGIKINLNLPLHELFYEVYSYTLDRTEFPRFETLRIACDFDPIEESSLNIEHRQNLCRFLEEALCNVGKHAEEASHLTVLGLSDNGWYTLQVIDDGLGIRSLREGEGTKQARKLAAQLKGTFKREAVSPKGTLCELTFPLTKLLRR
ncbi:putative transmembrane sensor domain protein [Leptolyngbyaceae cyanobacterium JSC-12]|nr:putative transmembrane sensor domain protein [Leptolyngbyaceae cyanobacterium JSC-12]